MSVFDMLVARAYLQNHSLEEIKIKRIANKKNRITKSNMSTNHTHRM